MTNQEAFIPSNSVQEVGALGVAGNHLGSVSEIGADPSEALLRPDLPSGKTQVMAFPGQSSEASEDASAQALKRARELSQERVRNLIDDTKTDTAKEEFRQESYIRGDDNPDARAERKSEAAFGAVESLQRPAGEPFTFKVGEPEVTESIDLTPSLVVQRAAEVRGNMAGRKGVPYRKHDNAGEMPARNADVFDRIEEKGGGQAYKQHDLVAPQDNRLHVKPLEERPLQISRPETPEHL